MIVDKVSSSDFCFRFLLRLEIRKSSTKKDPRANPRKWRSVTLDTHVPHPDGLKKHGQDQNIALKENGLGQRIKESDQFRFFHTDCLAHLKGSVGLILVR